jgi:hypothetical protein
MLMHDFPAVNRDVVGVHRTGTSHTFIFSAIPFICELHSPSPIYWTWSCTTSYKLAAPLSHHPRTGPRKRAPGLFFLQRLHLGVRRIFSGEQPRETYVFAEATIEFPSRRRSPWSASRSRGHPQSILHVLQPAVMLPD